MEGQASNESLRQLLALTSPGYDDELISLPYEHVQNHESLTVSESSYAPLTLNSSQWMDHQNYMNYLIQNQTSMLQREMPYSSNTGNVSGSDFGICSLNVQALKVEHPRPCSEEDDIVTNITSAEYLSHFQNQGQKGPCSPVKRRSRVAQTVPGLSSRSRGGSSSKRKAATMDQQRRARINERLEALQELLPSPKEGSQASVLDDIIDHIKYLQIRIKDLSQNRLAGEPSSYPFVFLEGYGHYTTQDNMLNEPLEELIGKLLEVNPLAVSELLQKRGLAIMPNCF